MQANTLLQRTADTATRIENWGRDALEKHILGLHLQTPLDLIFM